MFKRKEKSATEESMDSKSLKITDELDVVEELDAATMKTIAGGTMGATSPETMDRVLDTNNGTLEGEDTW